MKRLLLRFTKKQPVIDHKAVDAAYVQGASTERVRILAIMDKMIYDNRGMDSWTALLRQCRDSLENHHKTYD